MGLQHPDHQFKSGCRLSKSDVVVSAMMSDFIFFFLQVKLYSMKRFELIDTLRGISVISMILFHACWIMNHFGIFISDDMVRSNAFLIWERTICIAFITIAGFSFRLGKHHLKHGIITLTLGSVITVATCIFLPEIRIIFGILTFIGAVTLLMTGAGKIKDKPDPGKGISPILLLILFLALYVFTYNMGLGYLGFAPDMCLYLPKWLYKGYLATFIGFMEYGFYSSDYFPMIPWIFLYLCGYELYGILMPSERCRDLLTYGIPGIKFIGKHSLLIYIIHPIVLYVLIWIIASKMLQVA